MGPLAILTGDCINKPGFFLCMTILLGRKNVTVILRCQYNYQGGRKTGFHCDPNEPTFSKMIK